MIKMILPCVALAAVSAAVLDRIAVTVGTDAITESEVIEEIRITSFMNNEPLDFSGPARRAAADRLVDQYLIRHELAAGSYATPEAQQADKVLNDFTKSHFPSRTEFDKKLKQYGITEEDLKAHLLFQVQALEFTELRFNTSATHEADRAVTPAADAPAPDPPTAAKVDQQLDDWLKQIRGQTRIEFKKEAFQ